MYDKCQNYSKGALSINNAAVAANMLKTHHTVPTNPFLQPLESNEELQQKLNLLKPTFANLFNFTNSQNQSQSTTAPPLANAECDNAALKLSKFYQSIPYKCPFCFAFKDSSMEFIEHLTNRHFFDLKLSFEKFNFAQFTNSVGVLAANSNLTNSPTADFFQKLANNSSKTKVGTENETNGDNKKPSDYEPKAKRFIYSAEATSNDDEIYTPDNEAPHENNKSPSTTNNNNNNANKCFSSASSESGATSCSSTPNKQENGHSVFNYSRNSLLSYHNHTRNRHRHKIFNKLKCISNDNHNNNKMATENNYPIKASELNEPNQNTITNNNNNQLFMINSSSSMHCAICNRGFEYYSNLRRHIKTKHKIFGKQVKDYVVKHPNNNTTTQNTSKNSYEYSHAAFDVTKTGMNTEIEPKSSEEHANPASNESAHSSKHFISNLNCINGNKSLKNIIKAKLQNEQMQNKQQCECSDECGNNCNCETDSASVSSAPNEKASVEGDSGRGGDGDQQIMAASNADEKVSHENAPTCTSPLSTVSSVSSSAASRSSISPIATNVTNMPAVMHPATLSPFMNPNFPAHLKTSLLESILSRNLPLLKPPTKINGESGEHDSAAELVEQQQQQLLSLFSSANAEFMNFSNMSHFKKLFQTFSAYKSDSNCEEVAMNLSTSKNGGSDEMNCSDEHKSASNSASMHTDEYDDENNNIDCEENSNCSFDKSAGNNVALSKNKPYTNNVSSAHSLQQQQHDLALHNVNSSLNSMNCNNEVNTNSSNNKFNQSQIRFSTEIWRCPYCCYETTSASRYNSHLVCHGWKPYLCPHCGSRSNRLPDMRTHISTFHPEHNVNTFVVLNEEEAKATLKDYMKNRALINRKLKEMRPQPKFKCKLCPYASLYQFNLTKHVKSVHLTEMYNEAM